MDFDINFVKYSRDYYSFQLDESASSTSIMISARPWSGVGYYSKYDLVFGSAGIGRTFGLSDSEFSPSYWKIMASIVYYF